MDLEIAGMGALVTGASRGLGKAVATTLAREGASVVVAARGEPALEAAAAEIAADTAGTVRAVAFDATSAASVKALVTRAEELVGGIEILVNCAARPGFLLSDAPVEEMTETELFEEIDSKVMGYLRCIREVVPYMKARGRGRIVNIGGLSARQTGSIVGTIRNIAVAALTKNLADQLGRHGITVVGVHPAFMVTERTPDALVRRGLHHGMSAEQAEAAAASRSAIGRLLQVGEVADIISFLASPRATGINGDSVPVGGGIIGSIHY